MGTPSKLIVIIAGEASGDMRAAGLVRALKSLNPSLRFSGIGGEFMRQAGVVCFEDITALAVIGITEVLKNLQRIKRVFDKTLQTIDATHPSCVILVDYPGFNLRLARALKKRGIKVIYYISPQVWAWRERRILKIKKRVDRMIVLFPFEKVLYKKYGMNVDYVGHPLVDEVVCATSSLDIIEKLKLTSNKKIIGLMPGSRTKEIERHLPCMLDAAQKLYVQNKEYQFILLKASCVALDLIQKRLILHKNLPLAIYDGPVYDGMNLMDGIIVASGTATLEAALLEKPMVIIYKTSWITYALAKMLIKIPYIGLVNIVAGKKIVEEFIQNDANADAISKAITAALDNPAMIPALSTVKVSLGQQGASLRAAQIILEELVNTPDAIV